MRNLVGALSLAVLIAVTGAVPALADVTCRPGSLTPGCATQGAAAQNPALSALACQLQPSMPGCTTQTPTTPTPAPEPEPEPPAVTALTASFHGLPDAHDGKKLFTFELRFSEEFAGLRLGMVKQTLEVTGGRLVGVKRTMRGENRSMTVRVRPSSSGEVTVALPQVGWIWSAASATVSGPSAPSALSALTASFHGLPDAHDGSRRFSFEIQFSEEFSGLRLTALKEALEVTGGRLIDVKRTVRGQNRSVTVRVRPDSHAPVTVALGATEDCSAVGAICAKDGRMLSGSSSASVTSPAWQTAPVVRVASAAYLRSLSENLPRLPKNVGKTVSTSAPTGFPTSDTGTVVNMSHMGSAWSGKANVQVRERYGRGGHIAINIPCQTQGLTSTETGTCLINEGFISDAAVADWETRLATWTATPPADRADNPPVDPRQDGGVSVYGRWFSYPHDAGTNDMKVHLEVLRAAFTEGGKIPLIRFFKGEQAALDFFYDYKDFFKAEAHLEAPGTAVQPTGTVGTSATWTGKVVALDTGGRVADNLGVANFGLRGQLIGGDVSASVLFGSQARLNLTLTNLKGTNAVHSTYSNRSWSNVHVTNGSFSFSPGGDVTEFGPGPLEGTFRQQGTGTSPNTVGGTFEVPANSFGKDGMVGGFVATRN